MKIYISYQIVAELNGGIGFIGDVVFEVNEKISNGVLSGITYLKALIQAEFKNRDSILVINSEAIYFEAMTRLNFDVPEHFSSIQTSQ